MVDEKIARLFKVVLSHEVRFLPSFDTNTVIFEYKSLTIVYSLRPRKGQCASCVTVINEKPFYIVVSGECDPYIGCKF